VRIIWKQLRAGERELHIVALVLSPNSAIQAQWVARAKELFHLDGHESVVATDPATPGILSSLTYQSVTQPRHGSDDLNARARA